MKCCSVLSAKVLLVSLFFLSLQLFLVFTILKVDDMTEVSRWEWTVVCIPVGCACLFFFVTIFVGFFGTNNPADHMDLLIKKVRVDDIDQYNEGSTFFSVLNIFLVTLLSLSGFSLSKLDCECTTPYHVMSLAFCVTYALRAIFGFFRAREDFMRLQRVATEIHHYQNSVDDIKLQKLAKDIASRDNMVYKIMFEYLLVLTCWTFAGFGTIWIHAGNCASTCASFFHSARYMLYGVYFQETMYIVSGLSLKYFRRVNYIDGVDQLLNGLASAGKALV